MDRLHRSWTFGLVVVAALLCALPAASQTVLLVVRERVDAAALPPPLPVREGISDSLFNAGVIVLDAPGSDPVPAAPQLARMAKAAGADAVLSVATVYADTRLGTELLRISARTTYSLIDSSTSGLIGTGTEEATNRDREGDVDRAALGGEIGRKVAEQVMRLLDRRS
jgi:hypothetical protein